MSDSNRIRLAYAAETTFGVAPTGTYQTVRFTGEDLQHNSTYVESDEMRVDRQNSDVVNTDIGASGTVNGELSIATYDDWFQWGLQSSAAAANVTATTTGNFTFAAAGSNGGTITRSSGDWTTGGNAMVAGRCVQITGAANAENNGIFYIVSVTTTVLTLRGSLMVAEGPTAGTTYAINMIGYWTIGTTFKSMSIERYHSDLASGYPYDLFTGMTIGGFGLSARAGAILTANFSFVGKRGLAKASATASGYGAATTTSIATGIRHIQGIVEDYANATTNLPALELGFSLNNNSDPRSEIGALGPTEIGSGNGDVGGTLRAYLSAANSALQHKYDSDISTSLLVIIRDANNKGYALEMPAIKLKTSRRPGAGKNQPCILDMSYSALRDSNNVSFRMHRAA